MLSFIPSRQKYLLDLKQQVTCILSEGSIGPNREISETVPLTNLFNLTHDVNYFSCHYDAMSGRINLRKERFILSHGFRESQ